MTLAGMNEQERADLIQQTYLDEQSFTGTARKLGIDRRTVRRYMQKFFSAPEATFQRNAMQHRVPIDDVSHYWVKTGETSMFVRRDETPDYFEIRDKIIAEMKSHAPSYSTVDRVPTNDGGLLVIDLADVHVGKLSRNQETGFTYDMDEAVRRMRVGVAGLLQKASGFRVTKVAFVIGNDILHIDRPHRTTTSGTPQDTDGMWWQSFLAAKKAYVSAIEMLAERYDVHVIFCPSNHDYASGWMLADTISSWFSTHPNVHFGDDQQNVSIAHRKYLVFGKNLIGFTHGDGAKEKDLPALMQYEARAAWGQTEFATLYTHHTHHKDRKTYSAGGPRLTEKDMIGMTVVSPARSVSGHAVYVETVRSPSPPDGWHDRNGYVNMQAVEAFVHDVEFGPIARLTHHF